MRWTPGSVSRGGRTLNKRVKVKDGEEKNRMSGELKMLIKTLGTSICN